MSTWNRRRRGLGTAVALAGLLLLAADLRGRSLGDDNGRGISDVLGIPRIVHDSNMTEIDPSIAPPTDPSHPHVERPRKSPAAGPLSSSGSRTVQKPTSSKASRKAVRTRSRCPACRRSIAIACCRL